MDYSDAEFDRLVRLKEQVENEVIQRPGVTAVGVGFRTRRGELVDELTVKVYVEKKRADSELGDQLIHYAGMQLISKRCRSLNRTRNRIIHIHRITKNATILLLEALKSVPPETKP